MKVTVILSIEAENTSIQEVSTAIMYGKRQIEEYLVLQDGSATVERVFKVCKGETVLARKASPVSTSNHPTKPATPKAFVPFRPTLPQVSR